MLRPSSNHGTLRLPNYDDVPLVYHLHHRYSHLVYESGATTTTNLCCQITTEQLYRSSLGKVTTFENKLRFCEIILALAGYPASLAFPPSFPPHILISLRPSLSSSILHPPSFPPTSSSQLPPIYISYISSLPPPSSLLPASSLPAPLLLH